VLFSQSKRCVLVKKRHLKKVELSIKQLMEDLCPGHHEIEGRNPHLQDAAYRTSASMIHDLPIVQVTTPEKPERSLGLLNL
jgi:hypothetical protein